MSISEAKKRSIAKWDKENMTAITCRLSKKKAERFKSACDTLQITRNSVLVKAIDDTIRKAEALEGEQ